MMYLALLCLATVGVEAAKPAPASKQQLRADSKAVQSQTTGKEVPQTTAAPHAQVAYRTGADGITRPLAADVGTLVKLNNEGFSLKVEKKGDNANFPKRGDIVTVHYTGMLKDGTVFDSSRVREEPFSFPIGRGKVITGWDQGVITMSLGERAMLHLPSYKAYGSEGAPPAIPPNSELDFDIELLAINGQTVPKPQCTELKVDTQEACKNSCKASFGGEWQHPAFQAAGGFHSCSCSKDDSQNKWSSLCVDQDFPKPTKSDAPLVKPAGAIGVLTLLAGFMASQ
mmetsp:Transcript_102004/g.176965  ORF Transcript_102004/g.176965 Transcript_102004/m.176965 type:complete len:284 (+) Transcript_102004:69-920(+)